MNDNAFLLEHLDALLADRTLQGADAAENAAIRCLMQHHTDVDVEAMDRAAAALQLALEGESLEAMPAGLLNNLTVQAAAITPAPETSAPAERVVTPSPAPSPKPGSSRQGILAWTGWLVAAVAFLFTVMPSRSSLLSVNELKQRGALVVAGVPGPHGKPNFQGEIIWDSQTQQGYMKLTGFDVNNPLQKQYQLWIFDDRKFTETTPIDGGVFNVTSSGEVLIPIKPNIKVGQAGMFAITVEPPGGVIVSKRDPLIFLAKVPANPKS